MTILKTPLTLIFVLIVTFSFSQTKTFYLNNVEVEQLVMEFIADGKSRNIDITDRLIENVDFILVEIGSHLLDKNKRQLTGKNMVKSDRDKKFIILSESCLVDYYLLKGELYKELAYMLGVEYCTGENTILSNKRTKKYTHAYLSDEELSKEELDFLFDEVKKVM